MAQQFNYKCTDSSQLTELNIEYQPRQIKKRGFVGAIQHAYTLQIQVFWIGGIFYALEYTRRSAACNEQRIWVYDIGIIRGVPSKKALALQRGIAAYILNWYAIDIMKQTHLHGEICRYVGAFL